MIRAALFTLLSLVPSLAQAQSLTLGTVFENACVAPYNLFFGETDPYLRSWGFQIYPNDDFITFEHGPTGISGAYSPNPEDPFCMVHHPRGDVEVAERVGRTLLGAYFGETPTRLTAVRGISAWGVGNGGCCYLVVRVGNRTPMDTIGGASLSLFLRDR